MPSPLAHSAVGYIVAKVLLPRYRKKGNIDLGNNKKLVIAAVILSLLPDFDSGLGVIFSDFGRYHNNISHSLVSGLVTSVLIGLVVKVAMKAQFWVGFIATLIFYELHIVMDFFTYSRGIMLLWPFTSQRLQSDILLFYGLHWSDGFLSVNHIITLANEILFIALLVWVLKLTTKQSPNPEKDRIA